MSRTFTNGEVSTRLIVALTIVGVVAIAAVPLGFIIWPALKEIFSGPKPVVGVVRTAAELKALHPIDLPGGAKARIGISSDECYSGGCIMVYCLVEGNASAAPENPKGEYELGPLSYKVRPADYKSAREAKKAVKRIARPVAGFYCNTAAVAYGANGSYILQFYDWENKAIANASITARRDAPHPWRSIEQPWMLRKVMPKGRLIRGLDFSKGYAALPDTEQDYSSELPGRLPVIPFDMSEKATGDLKLARSGKYFVLSSDKPGYPFFNRNFLMRYCINGKPVRPEILQKMDKRHGGGLEPLPQPVRLDFDFNYTACGIRSGDRVTLQFMYVPDWIYTRKGIKELKMMKRLRRNEADEIRVSNKLEFTSP
ncbi:MAG: hypothetical protein ACYS8W_14990 [Planctomycetota bacterium]|jgi:hypothetical protein